jgi:hypothetical protein
MSFRIVAATAALLLATSTLALAADAPMPMQAKIMLDAQNGSGETATAVMTEADGNTTVTVTTKGAAPDVAQPIHIHKGMCAKDKLDPKPTYPLTTLLDGKSTTTLKGVTIAQLENGDYAINIHHSTSDIGLYVACGDIPKAKM